MAEKNGIVIIFVQRNLFQRCKAKWPNDFFRANNLRQGQISEIWSKKANLANPVVACDYSEALLAIDICTILNETRYSASKFERIYATQFILVKVSCRGARHFGS